MNWNFATNINMKWGLTQGMLGRRLASLAPSPIAMGPNTYVTQQDFLKMLGVALIVHLLFFGVAALFPRDHVTDIPVRALSFKLGDQDRIAAMGTPGVGVSMNAPSAPVITATNDESWHATPSATPAAIPAPLKPIAKTRPMQHEAVRETPREAPAPKIVPITEPQRQVPPQNPAPATTPAFAPLPTARPAIAPTPQQYVREVGGAPQPFAALPGTGALTGDADGSPAGQGGQSLEALRATYEQQISNWVNRHMPAQVPNGKQWRVVMRIEIDHSGYIRQSSIFQSSGSDQADRLAKDVISRANPVPAVPSYYSSDALLAFTIPLNFWL